MSDAVSVREVAEDRRAEQQRAEELRRRKADVAIGGDPKLIAIAERMYQHVADCIDWGALSGIEELLWHVLEQAGFGRLDDESGLSRRMIEHALIRAAQDPWARFRDVPYGITKQEERAVRFDPDCLFCVAEDQAADNPSTASADHDHEDDDCSLCDQLALDWRQQHAAKLQAATERRAARHRKRASRKG